MQDEGFPINLVYKYVVSS